MYTGREIAIIGLDGVFPKSKNIESFWNNLKDGKELISFDINEYLDPQNEKNEVHKDKNYITAHGSVDRKKHFDGAFFKYLPSEAKILDPQIRLFHEVVWHALEDAGVVPSSNNNIGLYAGASDNILWKSYNSLLGNNKAVDPFLAELLCDKDRLSTLISYKLNLQGPSITVRTACSTSLVSVHMASRALLTGECNIAVAGGVSLQSKHIPGYTFRENMIFSSDGHTKTFDKDSNGTIFSEGAGAVVLKRLKDAIRDKDNIQGIIKGSFINNDGSDKVGYTAPSISGQSKCINMALKVSQTDPETISYIEAHGTGTKIGDPIEIEALNSAYKNLPGKSCFIGSVKSNMGHLGAAAGIAGLIKVILSLKNRQIPPSINFNTPNPRISFQKGPFKVIDKLIDWDPIKNTNRRAGVSSFGIGGTNAHVILEEWPIAQENNYRKEWNLVFPFSAKTKESLYNYLQSFIEFLKAAEIVDLEGIAYTLKYGRKEFEFKKAITASTKIELIERLEKAVNNYNPIRKLEHKNTVFMFPGQGVQYFKMGLELYNSERIFKNELDNGFEELEKLTGLNFKEIVFEDNNEPAKIDDTKYTQPILFIFQYSIYKLLFSRGIKPDYLIGHSFGEYTAACISGVMSFRDTLKILLKRGRVIEKLPSGRMLGVSTSVSSIEKYLNNDISLASINSPDQCILSGDTEAIKNLTEKLKAENIEWRMLNIPFASHSSMIDMVSDEYSMYLQRFHYKSAEVPFVSNITGELFSVSENLSPDYWSRHLRQTVDFSKGIKNLDAKESTIFIDIGPGDALKRLFKQNKSKGSKNVALNLIRSKNEETEFNDDSQYFKNFICSLWEVGYKIDWNQVESPDNGGIISIPKYVFAKNAYPSTIDTSKIIDGAGLSAALDSMDNGTDSIEPYDYKIGETSNSELINELIELWTKFFGVKEIDVNDDFFDYGGDSLKALALIKIINARFNINLSIKLFFKNSSISGVAEEIENLYWIKKGNDKEFKNKITIE